MVTRDSKATDRFLAQETKIEGFTFPLTRMGEEAVTRGGGTVSQS
jgi:hypothetical protein